MNASIRREAIRAMESRDSEQVQNVQFRSQARMNKMASVYSKALPTEMVEEREELYSFLEELPNQAVESTSTASRNSMKKMYSASYGASRRRPKS
jgi:hypothetical protein